MKKNFYGFENSGLTWDNWDECSAYTKGKSGTAKGFKTLEEAKAFSAPRKIVIEERKIITERIKRAELTQMQELCVRNVVSWVEDPNKQEFVLAGYAGTGKTFLVRYIIDAVGYNLNQVMFSTFTGKASLVVTRKADGEYVCRTLHSTLYDADIKYDGTVSYTRKPKTAFAHIKLFVIDEASMVSAELLEDLMVLGIKVLFVGDHGQLQPVGERSWVYDRLKNDPDFVLTEIHRQAADNPIIKFATMARLGQEIPFGMFGHIGVIDKKDITSYDKSLLNASQIICGLNNTRQTYNNRVRELKGIKSANPVEGDKLICLRNNASVTIAGYGLVNGMTGYASNIESRGGVTEFDFTPDFVDVSRRLRAITKEILGETVLYQEKRLYGRDIDTFNYGYVVTCHKSQGSQWKNVFIINETFKSCEPNKHGYNPEWLYTALTRAEENAIIAMDKKRSYTSGRTFPGAVARGNGSL